MRAQEKHINARLHFSQDFGAEVTGRAGIVPHAIQTWYLHLLYVMHKFHWCRMFANDVLLWFPIRLDSSCWQRLLNFVFRRKAPARFFAMRCCCSGFKTDCCTAESSSWFIDFSEVGRGNSSSNICWDRALSSSIESRGFSGERVCILMFWKALVEQSPLL